MMPIAMRIWSSAMPQPARAATIMQPAVSRGGSGSPPASTSSANASERLLRDEVVDQGEPECTGGGTDQPAESQRQRRVMDVR